jgi:hypothetical protein
VILARVIHQLLVAEAPMWLLDEIDKWLRSFFWTGKKAANGRHCLIAWENICMRQELGGLGVKNLGLQGLALRARWE